MRPGAWGVGHGVGRVLDVFGTRSGPAFLQFLQLPLRPRPAIQPSKAGIPPRWRQQPQNLQSLTKRKRKTVSVRSSIYFKVALLGIAITTMIGNDTYYMMSLQKLELYVMALTGTCLHLNSQDVFSVSFH